MRQNDRDTRHARIPSLKSKTLRHYDLFLFPTLHHTEGFVFSSREISNKLQTDEPISIDQKNLLVCPSKSSRNLLAIKVYVRFETEVEVQRPR